MNKQRLLKFLPKFLEDRTDDDQFNDEKAWLVKAIGNLPDSIGAVRGPNSPDTSVSSPNGTSNAQSTSSAAQVRS